MLARVRGASSFWNSDDCSAAKTLHRFCALHSVARSIVAGLMPRAGVQPFPIGTLIVNVSGSFLLGIILVAAARQGEHGSAIRLLLAVGLCGGYTTFSTFSADTIGLLERGGTGLAAMNVAASVALALVATFAGAALARALLGRPY